MTETNTTTPTANQTITATQAAITAARKRFDEELAKLNKLHQVVAADTKPTGAGCTASCSGRGICYNGKCLCHQSTGDYCQHATCPLGCSGHGACDEKTGKCKCLDGYGGEGCEKLDCVPSGCSGHGNCTLNLAVSKTPFCTCAPGWTGPRCDVEMCQRSCSNNGKCVDGKCFCNAGYYGENCETGPVCPLNCGANGECKSNGKGEVGCVCKPGFTGLQCDIQVCAQDCGIHGICLNGKCHCDPNFSGDKCDKRTDCSPACTGNGECINGPDDKPTCACKLGFGGPDCAAKTCDKTCSGRGSCLDDKCICKNGWQGENCDKGCPEDCNGRGTCVPDTNTTAPVCLCRSPYYGPACNKGRCPGALLGLDGTQAFCSGHGDCDTATGKCKCERGYTGAGCSVFSVEECSKECHSLCKNGRPGAFKIADPLTGEVKVMLTSVCKERCEKKCQLSKPQ